MGPGGPLVFIASAWSTRSRMRRYSSSWPWARGGRKARKAAATSSQANRLSAKADWVLVVAQGRQACLHVFVICCRLDFQGRPSIEKGLGVEDLSLNTFEML